jgi:hypothetical protein
LAKACFDFVGFFDDLDGFDARQLIEDLGLMSGGFLFLPRMTGVNLPSALLLDMDFVSDFTASHVISGETATSTKPRESAPFLILPPPCCVRIASFKEVILQKVLKKLKDIENHGQNSF